MMAAAQPFISGAISKTVNLPSAATVDDVSEAFIQAWKLGLKAVAIYRDGCKQAQPLSAAGSKTANSTKDDAARNAAALTLAEDDNLDAPPRAVRHKLKEERMSITHKFNIGGHEGYSSSACIPMENRARSSSRWRKKARRFRASWIASPWLSPSRCNTACRSRCSAKSSRTPARAQRMVEQSDIGFAKSIMDYIFRWLQLRFMTGQQQFLFENLRPSSSRRPKA